MFLYGIGVLSELWIIQIRRIVVIITLEYEEKIERLFQSDILESIGSSSYQQIANNYLLSRFNLVIENLLFSTLTFILLGYSKTSMFQSRNRESFIFYRF